MATILLTAELGQGLGHVTRLAPIASELAAVGHRPVFAVRDVLTGTRYLRESGFPVLQAPYWQLPAWPGEQPFMAATYADLLARHGYGNVEVLQVMVQAWDTLLNLVDPQLIIADHSPTVCLAASDRVPVVMIGDGFTIPPASQGGYGVLSKGTPLAESDQILEAVQSVQRVRGRTVPESLPAAFVSAERFLVTFKELDPYRELRSEPLVGPLEAWPEPVEPTREPQAFVYLDGEYACVEQILSAFVDAGVKCSAYLRNQTPELTARLRSKGVQMHVTPQPLDSVLPQVSAIVHHAGLNTSTAALTAGRPQLVLPRYLEQDLNTNALHKLGVGRVLGGRQTMQSIGQALRDLIEDNSVTDRAQHVACELYDRGATGSLPRIIQYCQQLL